MIPAGLGMPPDRASGRGEIREYERPALRLLLDKNFALCYGNALMLMPGPRSTRRHRIRIETLPSFPQCGPGDPGRLVALWERRKARCANV
jgi:hypothetical protein